MIDARMPDGAVLRFPDDTPDDVIDRVARDHIAANPAPSAGRSLGIGVRDVLQGAAAVPGMLYDAGGAVINAGAAGLEALGGPSLPRVQTAQQNINRVADAAGLPQAVTPTERTVSAGIQGAASVLPTVGAGALMQGAGYTGPVTRMLLNGPGTQAVAGATGSMAQQGAADAGAGPVGQLAANILGGMAGAGGAQALTGAGRTASAIVEPLTEAGRQRIAAEALLRSSNAPDTLTQRLRAGLADVDRRLPESIPTTGMAARDPTMLRVESSVRGGALGPHASSMMGDADFARTGTRTQAIEAMTDNLTPETRGASIRAGLQGAEEGMRARVDQAFTIARDRNTSRYSTRPIMDAADEATTMFRSDRGGGGVPAELQSIIDDIGNLRAVDLSQAQNIRARLGEVAGTASAAGQNQLASAAGRISQALENTIDDPRWMQAVDERRTMGRALGRDDAGVNAAGSILRQDRWGTPTMPDARVGNVAINDPGAVRQVIQAGLRGLDDARTARIPEADQLRLREQFREMRNGLRGQFMENMLDKTRTTATTTNTAGATQRQLSLAQFQRFWDDNQAVARELFEPGQYLQLRRIARDFDEGSMAANTGATRNSQTAQNLSVGNMISRMSNGLISADNPAAQQVGSLGGLLRLVYAAPEQATRDMLVRSMVDPQFASMLLEKATPAAMRRAQGYIERNMMGRIADASGRQLSQQAVRTAIAPDTQQSEQRQAPR